MPSVHARLNNALAYLEEFTAEGHLTKEEITPGLLIETVKLVRQELSGVIHDYSDFQTEGVHAVDRLMIRAYRIARMSETDKEVGKLPHPGPTGWRLVEVEAAVKADIAMVLSLIESAHEVLTTLCGIPA